MHEATPNPLDESNSIHATGDGCQDMGPIQTPYSACPPGPALFGRSAHGACNQQDLTCPGPDLGGVDDLPEPEVEQTLPSRAHQPSAGRCISGAFGSTEFPHSNPHHGLFGIGLGRGVVSSRPNASARVTASCLSRPGALSPPRCLVSWSPPPSDPVTIEIPVYLTRLASPMSATNFMAQ